MNTAEAFQWPAGKRAAVSLTFDDARASQVLQGLQILDAHDVKATFYVHVPAMSKQLDRWKSAVANGHEIGNHTLRHPCSANFRFARENPLENYTLPRIEDDLL